MSLKSKIFIVISSLLVGALVLLIFVIWPTLKDIRNISEEIYNERVALEEKYKRGQSLRKANDDFNKVKEKIPLLESLFITEDEELKFITILEELAKKYNLKKQIKLESEGQKLNALAYTLPLELSLNGDFMDILRYLSDLEELDYYFNIDTFLAGINLPNEPRLLEVPSGVKILPEKNVVNVILKGTTYLSSKEENNF